METPYSKAWAEWIASPQGKQAVSTLTLPAGDRRYLENRLRNAFDAGWHAANAAKTSENGSVER